MKEKNMNNLVADAIARLNGDGTEQNPGSTFIVDDENNPKILEVRNGVLIFANFAGRANKFGKESKNFNVIITPELKAKFENGFFKNIKGEPLQVKVHSYGKGEEDDPEVYYINVKINMTVKYPPQVTLYTDYDGRKSKTSLTDETIGCLDRIDMKRCDFKVNVKESQAREGWAVFYLRKFDCQQFKSPDYGGAYADWDDDPLAEDVPGNSED